MHHIGKIIAKFLVILYYWIDGIILFLIPRKFKYKDITGEIVLITGAGSGIGRSMALKFARKGAILVLWDINPDGNKETASLIEKENGKAYAYSVDITNRNAVNEAAANVKNEVGVVNIVINNAGIVVGKRLLDIPDNMIEKVFNVNVLSHFWITKAFLPDMIERDHGHFVTIASLAGLGGIPKLTDYCASKFAAVGLMEALFLELRSEGLQNIHTTTVCPYFINTGMFDGAGSKLFKTLEPEYVADQVIAAVLCNQQMLLLPRPFYLLITLKTMMPTNALLALHDACGSYHSMKTFIGRTSKNKIN